MRDMMKRIEIIKKIIDYGIVAVIRAESKEQGVKIVDAVKKGGIKVSELNKARVGGR
jgi:2-dehydro-3-deoxyphosphogluconate aldolase / (4S)-4-hydroxy-2-oxoglutarate aldolase